MPADLGPNVPVLGQIDSHASKIEYYDQLYTKQL